MNIIIIGLLVLLIGIFSSLFKFLYTGYIFIKYIKEKYPLKWEEVAPKNNISKALFPFSKGTSVYFLYKSNENFGDEKITELRKRIKQHTFFLVIVYPLSFLIYIILVFYFLKKFTGVGGNITFFWD
ncbi:MAG: hypothetical protein ACMUIP_04140 [bacterium]